MTKWKHVFRNLDKLVKNEKLKCLESINIQPLQSVLCRSSFGSDSCPVAQFGRTASSRKILGSSIFFPFPNDEAHRALGNFKHSRNCFVPFPRSIPPHNSISEFYGQFLGPHGGVSALTGTVNCGTLYRKVRSFLNHVPSIDLATGELQSSCRDISRMIKGNWIHLSSSWSVAAKGLNN